VNQQQLADRLGVSQAMVSRLLSGDRRPSIALMNRIKDVLGWSLDAQAETMERGEYGQTLRYVMVQAMTGADREAALDTESSGTVE
jgi:transcriptional regulator with XRE-family HTH domain